MASDRANNDVMNLGRLLSDTARRLPDRIGLVWGERQWSWRALDDRVNALVRALQARGLGKGDRILVQAKNSNQLFETLFAAFKLGAVWVPCNFRLTPPEVAYLASSSHAKAMIADDSFQAHVEASRAAARGLGLVVIIGKAREGQQDYEALLAEGAGAPAWEEEVGYDDPCSIELFQPKYWELDPLEVAKTCRESALKVLTPHFKVE